MRTCSRPRRLHASSKTISAHREQSLSNQISSSHLMQSLEMISSVTIEQVAHCCNCKVLHVFNLSPHKSLDAAITHSPYYRRRLIDALYACGYGFVVMPAINWLLLLHMPKLCVVTWITKYRCSCELWGGRCVMCVKIATSDCTVRFSGRKLGQQ